MDVSKFYKPLFFQNSSPKKEIKNDPKLSNKIQDAMIASGGNIIANNQKENGSSIIYLG